MTVDECKIKALALMDENDLGDIYPYTSDADIAAKLPLFITMGERMIAQQQRIVKTAIFTNPYTSASASHGAADPLDEDYLLFVMPSDFYQLKKIMCDDTSTDAGTFTLDGKLRVTGEGKWQVYYHAMPAEVIGDTTDSTVLPLSEDCAIALPYYVAANVLLSDGDESWVNYMSQFNTIIASLTTGKTAAGARVVV